MESASDRPATAIDGLGVWLDELDRLVEEAKERLEAGELIPVLATLAAVPAVHGVLVDGCSGLLTKSDDEDGGENETDEDDKSHFGNYI